jgi:cell wall-associated NlpC family hydrolase
MGFLDPGRVTRVAVVACPDAELLGGEDVVRLVESRGIGLGRAVASLFHLFHAARSAGAVAAAATVCGMRRLVPLLIAALLLAGCGRDTPAGERDKGPREVVLTPEAARKARSAAREEGRDPRSRPRVVELRGAGAEQPRVADPNADAPSPGAASDAEVRAELREARAALRSFKAHLSSTAYLQTGPRAKVLPDGTAVAPDDAPEVVKRVILAANEIAKFPYKWGGGHGAWRDNGYDCSGSVSFALAGAGLLQAPLTSGGFVDWGAPGNGEWITIYANYGHIFMVVAGLRFDTSGRGRAGTRWQQAPRSTRGFAMRHMPGL